MSPPDVGDGVIGGTGSDAADPEVEEVEGTHHLNGNQGHGRCSKERSYADESQQRRRIHAHVCAPSSVLHTLVHCARADGDRGTAGARSPRSCRRSSASDLAASFCAQRVRPSPLGSPRPSLAGAYWSPDRQLDTSLCGQREVIYMKTPPIQDDGLSSAMHDVASRIDAYQEIGDVLAAVTAAAVDLLEHVDYADVLTIADGTFRSVKPTTPVIVELDQLQFDVGEGPCLDAATGSEAVVRCADLRVDRRWPAFSAGAVEKGVHTALSFQLYTHSRGAGALNMFGRAPHTFDPQAETLGSMLATQAAIAIIADDRTTQFNSALASRDVIGQAKGVIMERFAIGALAAFEMMRQLSQDRNEKLTVVAQRVIDSRP